ncbi:MAG: hypothetical protein QM674_09020 [Burkholderiaceae bacterium]
MLGIARSTIDLLDMFVVYFNNIDEAHFKNRWRQPAANARREPIQETS